MTQNPTTEAGRLVEQVASFADLRHNWDSYGAEPLDQQVLAHALRVAALLPTMQAVPGADGSISFEGHKGDDELSVTIEADRHPSLYVMLDGYEFSTDDDIPRLTRAFDAVRPEARATAPAGLREALEGIEWACPDCDGVWWFRGEGEEDDATCGNDLHRAIKAALDPLQPDVPDLRVQRGVVALRAALAASGETEQDR
ncbi:MAG TPA: hypothetical protein VFP22_02865 [Candidatus Limnocylindrales bacterium]|nr:hypothetical protein [Candidatus Limnocylindrales bacterium]